MFELSVREEQISIVREQHYKLVPQEQITKEELEHYRATAEAPDES